MGSTASLTGITGPGIGGPQTQYLSNNTLLLVTSTPWPVLGGCHLAGPHDQAHYNSSNHLNQEHVSGDCSPSYFEETLTPLVINSAGQQLALI